MLTPVEIENIIISIKPVLKEEYGISSIGYFGSFANGNYTENSDVDILIKYNKALGWKFFDLKDYLESILKRKVDLVTERAIKKQWKNEILKQVRYI